MRQKLEQLRLLIRSVGAIECAAYALFVGLGWLFRTRGVLWGGTFGFWNDEASWAMRLLERPLAEHLIRPPLFMWLTRLSVAVLGKTEFAFRLLPWLAGMATPLIAVFLARRVLQNAAARILLVGVLALSEGAIDFSKEFKPYGIGIFLHLLLPFLVLRWVHSRTRKDLLWACSALPLGVLFCQDVMFLYPGLFLVMAVESYRAGALKQLYIVVGFGALTAVFVSGMYLAFWRHIPKDQAEDYWGKRYGVFHRPKSASDTYTGWVWDKYHDVIEMPNQRRAYWSDAKLSGRAFYELRDIDSLVWPALHLLGVALIFTRRRWKEGLCFWSPLMVCVLFNYLGFWPFGAFRTDQFLLAETSVVAALGLDWPVRGSSRWRMLVPAFVLLILPLLLFEDGWSKTKVSSPSTQMLEMIKQLDAWQKERPSSEKEQLYLDHHSCMPFQFYIKYHPRGRRLWKSLGQSIDYRCNDDFGKTISAMRRLPKGARLWVMSAQKPTRKRWPSEFSIAKTFRRPPHELFETHAP
jgi:hypothetical protein